MAIIIKVGKRKVTPNVDLSTFGVVFLCFTLPGTVNQCRFGPGLLFTEKRSTGQYSWDRETRYWCPMVIAR